MQPTMRPITPYPLPMPEIDRLPEVMELFDRSSVAWQNGGFEEFIQLLAKAFCLDTHDFTMLMAKDKHMRRACTCLAMMNDEPAHSSISYHTLKMAMALVDCSGFVYKDGYTFNDHSRNYVIRKWTHAIPSTLRLLVCLEMDDGSSDLLPDLEHWKVLQVFGILVDCLGNIKLATRCQKKVRVLASSRNVDFATMTEIDRDLSGLEGYPANTCCVCHNVGFAKICSLCGISCYCSKRCQKADWDDQHREICPKLVGWKAVVFKEE
jgi:hypothetical protein